MDEKPNLLLPPPKKHFAISKAAAFLVGFFVIILVVLGATAFYLLRTPVITKSRADVPLVFPTTKPLTEKQQIAKSFLNWTQNKKDERGIYFQSCRDLICKEHVVSGKSGHAGLPLLWGKFMFYQKTSDQDILKDLLADLNAYTDSSKIASIQNQNWNCLLMKNLYDSLLSNQEIKSKAETLCFNSEYFPIEESSLNIDKDLENFLDNKTASLAKLTSLEENGVRVFVYYPSDFVARFQWKNNPKDLIKAKDYFDLALRGYAWDKDKLQKDEICALGQSAVDLYKALNQPEYLQAARDLFAKEFNPNIPTCGYLANSLYKTTGEENYLYQKDLVLNSLVKDNSPQILDLPGIGLLIGLLSE